MQSRRLTAELERDAAIEEAARAVLQLRSARKEVLELKRSLAQCHKDRESDDANGEEARKRHDRILWYVAQLADTLWTSLYESRANGGVSSCVMTRAQLKLQVLTALRDAVPKEQHVMYEEMHELYTEIARHEAQQQRTARQVRSLQQDNERLKLQLMEEKAVWGNHHEAEMQTLQMRLEAMEMQIARLKEDNIRLQSRELETPSSVSLIQDGSHQQHKSTMSLLLLESVHVSEFQQDEPIQCDDENELQDISSQCDLESTLVDKQTIKLLQAQVEMYARYHRRRRDEAEANEPPIVPIA